MLFEYEKENNTIKDTVVEAKCREVKLCGADLSEADLYGADLSEANLYRASLRKANLSEANLFRADLRQADLEGANLSEANLCFADLDMADLYQADLREAEVYRADLSNANFLEADLDGADLGGANLYGAYLRGARNIPQSYINLCSRDMLFIFEHLKAELPFLREKLIKGEVDGTQREGGLIETLAKVDGGIEKVCSTIPFYEQGLENPGEQWFWNIRTGDTPHNSFFAEHAVKLIDMILGK